MKKVLLIILIGILFVSFVFCTPLSEESKELPAKMIEDVCNNYGQGIELLYNGNYGEEKYLSKIYNVKLDDPQYTMQINISDPYKAQGRFSISFSRDIGEYDNKQNGFKQYYGLVVDLINLYNEQTITREDIEMFFDDESNIVKENYPHKEEGFFYVIEKSAEINQNCGMNYQIYTFLNEETNEPEEGYYAEEWIIHSYS